ncbi:MAG TPA: glycosyltransferase family 9 protein [Chloroflexota bacterium]
MTGPEAPLTRVLNGPVRRIAVVRALHIGDLLLAVPGLRALRRAFPNAEITLVGLPWARVLVDRLPYLDRLAEFPGYPGMLEVDEDPARTAAFLREARAYGYDLAVQMHGNGRASNAFTLELGARATVGYYPPSEEDSRLTLGFPYPDHLPEPLRHVRLMQLLGLPVDDARLELPLLPEDAEEVRRVPGLEPFLARRPVVGLHVGARPPARRWPVERFAALGETLARRHDASLVLLGGPGEERLVRDVERRLRDRARVMALPGTLSLGGLAALIARLDLFVGNDSGPAHMAVALDTPSVTVFGPADRRRWAPLDRQRHRVAYREVACSPCPHWECPIDHRCLRWVTVEQVLQLVEDLLASPAASRPSPSQRGC